MAVVVAARDAATRGAPSPPAALRPFLRFTRLPDRALLTVRRVLDGDDSFRSHVLASVDAGALDRAAELFLRRPEGWEEELAVITEAAVERARSDDEARREVEAVRRAEQLDSAVQELRGELADLKAELESTSSRLHREEAARRSLERELAAARTELDAAGSDTAEAVRQLKVAESLAERRLTRVRELEAAAAPAGDPLADTSPADTSLADTSPADTSLADTSPADTAGAADAAPAVPALDPVAMEEVGRAVDAAAEAAAALSASLAEVASRLRVLAPVAEDAPPATPVDPALARAGGTGQGTPTGSRRVPVRVGRGLTTDSVEGVEQLLGTPEMVVLVDGYNASMSAWPDQPIALQRDRLVQALGQVRHRTGAEVHVVFDGAHDGNRPAVGAPLPVRVHFTEAGVEADDRLLDMVSAIDPARPVAVVSGDHRVRDGAVQRGANVVSPSVLLDLGRR